MIFFGKILLKTLYFFITNISELDFEEKKSAEIVLHPMHGGGVLSEGFASMPDALLQFAPDTPPLPLLNFHLKSAQDEI